MKIKEYPACPKEKEGGREGGKEGGREGGVKGVDTRRPPRFLATEETLGVSKRGEDRDGREDDEEEKEGEREGESEGSTAKYPTQARMMPTRRRGSAVTERMP